MILRKAISALILIAVLLNVFSLSLLGEEPQKPIELMPLEELPTVIREEKISLRGHLYRIDDDSELDTVRICNADGTISVYKFAENVKYVDEDGKTRDKTNDVYVDENGNAVNKNNDIRYTLSSAISEGVTVSYGDVSVKMTPKSEMPTEDIGYSIEEQKSRAYPQKIVYEGVFSPSDRVEYTPAYSGLKEDIILYERPETNVFSWLITVENATLKNEKTYIDIFDNKGESIGKFGAISAMSANWIEFGGEYSMTAVSTENETTVYELSVVLDREYLDSPEVEYPIVVDPPVTILIPSQYFDSGIVKNILDASLYSNGTGVQTGHYSYLYAGYKSAEDGCARSVIKFPGLMNDATFLMMPNNRLREVYLNIYSVSDISIAYVSIYQYTGQATYPDTDNWTENSIKSNRSSSYDSSIWFTEWVGSGTLNQPDECFFDITNHMKDWKTSYWNNPNGVKKCDYGLLIRNCEEVDGNEFVRFLSSDSTTYSPYLEYTYFASESFTILGKYTDKFAADVGGATTASAYLQNTVSFLNTVYSRDFNIGFSCSSISQETSILNNCSAHSAYSPCSVSRGCGSDCRNGHHQNREHYMDIYDNVALAQNQILLLAERMTYGTMCREIDGVHTTQNQQAMGCTRLASNTSSRGIVATPGLYLDCVPRAYVLTTVAGSTYSSYKQSTMKLVAAHEIAHVMGLGEMYLINTLPEHDRATEEWVCVMRRFDHPRYGYDFVSEILAPGSTKSGFCDHCKSILAKSITVRYFPAYTPAP